MVSNKQIVNKIIKLREEIKNMGIDYEITIDNGRKGSLSPISSCNVGFDEKEMIYEKLSIYFTLLWEYEREGNIKYYEEKREKLIDELISN